MIQKGETARVFMGRLPFRGDLLESVEELAREANVTCGRVEIIGAVEQAVVSYYHQEEQKYQDLHYDQHLEILSCVGNISLKDGEPKAHLHITLADSQGQTWGGHLQKGTVIFAGEIVLQEIQGPELHRGFDKNTGLPLWEM